MNAKSLFFLCFLSALLLISVMATEPSKDGRQGSNAAEESDTDVVELQGWGGYGGGPGWGYGGHGGWGGGGWGGGRRGGWGYGGRGGWGGGGWGYGGRGGWGGGGWGHGV